MLGRKPGKLRLFGFFEGKRIERKTGWKIRACLFSF